jgi:hypothetical protein
VNLIVDPQGQPTTLTRHISHAAVGGAAAWAIHEAFGERNATLVAFIVVYLAHAYFDAPLAYKIAEIAT